MRYLIDPLAAAEESKEVKDPALLIDSTIKDLLEFLSQDFDDEKHLKDLAFYRFLEIYEGSDIIDVICREAAVLSIYENSALLLKSAQNFSRDIYMSNLAKAAEKYAMSENWPKAETDRAGFFRDYVGRF